MIRTAVSAAALACAFATMASANGTLATVPTDGIANQPNYVRSCDEKGIGYFYVPGTESCIRFQGLIRFEPAAGDSLDDTQKLETYQSTSRFTLRVGSTTESDYGPITTMAEARFSYVDGGTLGVRLYRAYIGIGDFLFGAEESAFVRAAGDLGRVVNNSLLPAGGYTTGQLAYSFTPAEGVKGIVSLEQGSDDYADVNGEIDGDMPNIVLGLRKDWENFSLSGAGAYDSPNDALVAKVRVDYRLEGRTTFWGQAAFKDLDDVYAAREDGTMERQISSFYGTWGGKSAVWAGGTFGIREDLSANFQMGFDDANTFAASANVIFEPIRTLSIIPELTYISYNDENDYRDGNDAVQAIVRIEKLF
ncbi:porin [Paracoccus aestuariivivens]|uniref:Porin n=1 Tax=Paracoccus aestuariivivens TaxID=1820333 RepID=A0A6L6JCQ4_9RHOB|nr:porin [Paracoccus aestuariivivens]MTH79983.1 hypothetical protein [Paracoccus aestuariivivens]